jgi:hypothetical protein
MELWTGIACLKAKPEVKNFRRFDDGCGAFVNVVAWAESGRTFEDNVRMRASELDCILMELEEVKPLVERMNEHDYPEELITMRETATRQPADTIFGTFHIWHQDDAN